MASPSCGCGRVVTRERSTAGCWSSTAATSSGEDFVAGDVDHGRGPPVEDDSSRAIAVCQVAGQKPAFAQHFVTRPRRAEVTRKHAGASQGQLSRFTVSHGLHALVQDGRVKAGQRSSDGFGMRLCAPRYS